MGISYLIENVISKYLSVWSIIVNIVTKPTSVLNVNKDIQSNTNIIIIIIK